MALSYYGKYQLQTASAEVASAVNTNTDIEYVAFNAKYPNGVPLNSIIGEALP